MSTHRSIQDFRPISKVEEEPSFQEPPFTKDAEQAIKATEPTTREAMLFECSLILKQAKSLL